jgi:capsular polysaccharide biosynthesis protein
MRFKQELVKTLGVEDGFRVYRERVKLPDSGRIRLSRLQSQYTFAKTCGEPFIETDPGGERFVIEPPKVIGEGVSRPMEHVSRPLYVACLGDVRVRGRSAVTQIDGLALLDYLDWERELFDCELEIDPAIFNASRDAAWTFAPQDDSASLRIEEAYTLLGPNSGAFGDWMMEYLPEFVAADMSGSMPPVPLLVDAQLPETIQRCIEVMVRPGVEIIKIPAYATARVRRLWCAPSLHYAPGYEKMQGRFRWDYLCPAPRQFLPVVREIARRAAAVSPGEATGPTRVFLGRKPRLWRRLVNYAPIEAAAEARDFLIVYPEELSFDRQVDLLRHARYVVAPEGSALFLLYFARPGTKLCILDHTLTEAALSYRGVFDDLDISIFTGAITEPDPEIPERGNYRIDLQRFRDFLDDWLTGGSARPTPPTAAAAPPATSRA